MKTKVLFFCIALLMCVPFICNAQLYVDSLGIVQVGNYEYDIYAERESWAKDTFQFLCSNFAIGNKKGITKV